MEKEKREKLEANGWKVTTVAEFLELASEDEKIIESRLALSASLPAKEKEDKNVEN